MKIKRFLSLVLSLLLVLSLSGCGNREEPEDPNSVPEVSGEDELVLYHNSTALAPMLMSLTEEYSKATGKKISAKLSGNDFLGEMQSNSAVIYVVDTNSDLSEWHSGGLFSDLINDSGLSSVASGIPAGLQLNPAGIGSYGVPLVLEGYGYIFDKEMISALFGKENSENLINDLKTCSFTEFEGFVAAVDTYISAPSAAEITIGGSKYTFAKEKNGKALNLTGVFSLNNESTRAMEHLLSTALAAKFASRYEVMTAAEEAVSGMNDILSAYVEVLDLHTSHISGAEGSIGRGDEFIGGDYNYSTAVDLFTRGNALFYPGGTFDTGDFEKSAEGFSENLDIIPMKLPLSDDEITAAGMTAEKLQSSIVIGSRYYLTVNPKADETSSAAAKDFINWIYSNEAGKNAFSSAFGGVPFNFEYIMGDSVTEENPPAENQSEVSSESESSEGKTKSGTASPENTSQSGTESGNPGLAEEESSGEENPDLVGPMIPSHSISNSLMASVAEYYAAGNWIPDLSFALPADFTEKILGENLSDYWGMETWADSDRKNFVDTIIGGWKERLDKENSAVG
ncbi:MAG: extracellular solute-binding protein [Oscillospiraceae bacterium]|nr:extracellular solute-binding protein [Oscillospiraceae bacterium]